MSAAESVVVVGAGFGAAEFVADRVAEFGGDPAGQDVLGVGVVRVEPLLGQIDAVAFRRVLGQD